MAPFAQRLSSAQMLADGRRIIATDWEFRLGERYTWRTILELKKRFPCVQFVWLMGSDGFAHFTRWRRWRQIARSVPVAIFPRPYSVISALKGKAAAFLHRYRHKTCQAAQLPAQVKLPCWVFLSTPRNPISSTIIRESGHKSHLKKE